MSKNELYSWLIPYLEGELDPQRKAAVEARLSIDAEYAGEADRLRNVLRHVQASSAIATESEPEFSIWPKVQSQLRAHPAQSRWSPRLSLAAGAFATALIGVAIAHPWERAQPARHGTTVAFRPAAPAVAGIVEPPKVDAVRNELQRTAKNLERTYNFNVPAPQLQPKPDTPIVVNGNADGDIDTSSGFGSGARIAAGGDPFSARPASTDEAPGAGSWRPAPRLKQHPVNRHNETLPLRGGIVVATSGNGPELSDSVVPSATDVMRGRLHQSDTDPIINPMAEVTSKPVNTYAMNTDDNSATADSLQNHHAARVDYGALPSPLALSSKAFSIGGGGGVWAYGHKAHEITDGQELRTMLQTASMHANRGNVNAAMDYWRDAMLFELQPPTYNEEGATAQATSILETIRKTGNLLPFRAFVEHQASPTPDEVADWRILGLLYGKQGNNTLSLNAWKYVTQSGKASGEDWYQLGVSRQAIGDTANARIAFAHAVSNLPTSAAHYSTAQQAIAAGQ